MAWRVDKDPIEYLEQRVRYYKKKEREFKNHLKDEDMLRRFGKEGIEGAIANVELRILEFQYAIKILKTYTDVDRT